MSSDKIKATRTVALVGHGGSGKTSLAEAMLFNAKAVDRLGKVDEGTSVLDWEPEEAKRGGSISASFGHYAFNKHNVNLVDAPGDDNFLSDAASVLRAVDGVVMVADAIDGVKVQGEKVWQYVDAEGLPALVVVNKMDRERADFETAVNMIPDMLGIKAVRLQIPIGAAESFQGVVDLLANKAYTFDGGKMTIGEVPGELADAVAEAREVLIEDIAEADDTLMERYLEGEELTADDLAKGLAKGVSDRLFLPVAAAAALKNMGVQPVMDLLNRLLPSPLERGAVKGVKPDSEDEEIREPDAGAPFSGLVFKTVADPFAGRLSMVRIFSGTLTSDMQLLNPNREAKERFGQLYVQTGKTQKSVSEALPGDIVAIPKLKETHTGDTLCTVGDPIQYPTIEPLPAVISYAIEAKEKGDEEKVFAGINKLLEEDPTLRLDRDPQTNEALLSGMGSVHIETTLDRLKRKFSVEVNLKTPKVPYRETIKGSVRVQGRYKKQTGGRGQFGDTWLEISPAEEGEGYVFLDEIVGGAIPRQYIPAVEKGIAEAMQGGVLAGYPMVDVKVRLVDGSFHAVDSSEMAFKVAGSLGFKKGAVQCKPTLLEPIMKLVVMVPEDAMGDVMGDISSRRGRVLGMDAKGSLQIISALVPMSEVLTYQPELTSMTGGRGAFTMEMDHYEEVPGDVQAKIVEAYEQAKEEGN
ncbi:MAG: elongation factor G [Desulfarculaceae bacterium]|nr:elongation factor G [Desulfarculaceae bacterium]MCF8073450.1 elongation factor G [Desulfarculaceae bacterium]MCF8100403.1 elongation factor G [Desulfarculaceae bacterium]MCF8115861.1 elongation factor G [Desulfarculaceae bacterium]